MKDSKVPAHKQAKMDLLHHLRSMAMDMIHTGHEAGSEGDQAGPDLHNAEMGDHAAVKKAVVASNSSQGLATGLEKAKELVQGGAADHEPTNGEYEEGTPEEEAHESHEEAMAEGDDHPEAIMAKIEHLKAKLAKHKK